MPRKVRNPFGVVSIIPDDYPPELLRQLGLVEEPEEGTAPEVHQEATQEAERPQPQRRRRR